MPDPDVSPERRTFSGSRRVIWGIQDRERANRDGRPAIIIFYELLFCMLRIVVLFSLSLRRRAKKNCGE